MFLIEIFQFYRSLIMEQKPLKTRQQVLEDFARRGQSIRGWAKANSVDPSVAHGVLSGKLTGRIGESHKAAVKLGLKHGEIVEGGDNE